MSYKNANGVLPRHLLHAIQQYIDGEYLYIPRKESEKLPWGAKRIPEERFWPVIRK